MAPVLLYLVRYCARRRQLRFMIGSDEVRLSKLTVLSYHCCVPRAAARRWYVGRLGKQRLNTGGERAMVNSIALKAVHPQEITNCNLDDQHVIDKLIAGDGRCAQQVQRRNICMHGTAVSEPHCVSSGRSST